MDRRSSRPARDNKPPAPQLRAVLTPELEAELRGALDEPFFPLDLDSLDARLDAMAASDEA